MSKLRYIQIKGRRTKRRFFHGIRFGFNEPFYWWSHEYQRWILSGEDLGKKGASSHFDGCRSVRAFKRRLREWSSYLPRGTEFILCSRHFRNDVFGRIPRSPMRRIKHG